MPFPMKTARARRVSTARQGLAQKQSTRTHTQARGQAVVYRRVQLRGARLRLAVVVTERARVVRDDHRLLAPVPRPVKRSTHTPPSAHSTPRTPREGAQPAAHAPRRLRLRRARVPLRHVRALLDVLSGREDLLHHRTTCPSACHHRERGGQTHAAQPPHAARRARGPGGSWRGRERTALARAPERGRGEARVDVRERVPGDGACRAQPSQQAAFRARSSTRTTRVYIRRGKAGDGEETGHAPFTLAGWLLEVVGWLLAPNTPLGRERQRSLMRRSSKSRHIGMIVSIESLHTTSTRSSRCRSRTMR